MKNIFRHLSVLVLFSIQLQSNAQTVTQDSTLRVWVNGVCDMCKDRIETAFQRKGIYSAVWDIDSHILTLKIDPLKITVEKVHTWAAAAGHDTELKKASNNVYFGLPACCRYREKVNPHTVPLPAISNDTPRNNLNGSVRGIVLELDKKGNFLPLQGATVYWLGVTMGAQSNEAGIFSIPLVEGHRKLIVSYTGFKPDTLEVEEEKDLKVILARGKDLKIVEVTARQRSAYISSMSTVRTQIMTERELFKAACCNLSESFETNPSVDVAYNDALSGSKQIQMLGLSGNYSQLTVENMPGPRGLATSQGLNYIPGPWISSIQLTKGVGSVANGFESIAGQINVEMKKPDKGDRLFANMYVNDMGKTDLNIDMSRRINNRWSTTLMLHDNFLNNKKVDDNKDGFRDVPVGNLFTVLNRWHYDHENGWMVQFGWKVLTDDKTGGQLAFDRKKDMNATNIYGMGFNTNRYEGFMKVGYVFPQKKFKSIGWQLASYDHQQDNFFGTNRYNAQQNSWYSNMIYQSIIGTTDHKFRTGWSLMNDTYKEQLNGTPVNHQEIMPGAFFEYTYSYLEKFSSVIGIRYDHHNSYGNFITPRLHLRYEPVKGTTLRFSGGRGQRTALVFAENTGAFASSRSIIGGLGSSNRLPYGLEPEVAWNGGITLDQKLNFFNRNASLSVDYFYTWFTKQVVVDWENPASVSFYNLKGKSYSSSIQVSLDAELLKKLEWRLAWRLYDVKTQYQSQLLQKPLTARLRAFTNLAYEWEGWKWDLTYNWVGPKRLPLTVSSRSAAMRPLRSPAYGLINAQMSKSLGKQKQVELYVGAENLGNYMQPEPIVNAYQPFQPYFDASQVWGPVFGRMLYGGLRVRVK